MKLPFTETGKTTGEKVRGKGNQRFDLGHLKPIRHLTGDVKQVAGIQESKIQGRGLS